MYEEETRLEMEEKREEIKENKINWNVLSDIMTSEANKVCIVDKKFIVNS